MTTYRDKLIRSFCKRMTVQSLREALEFGIDALSVIEELAKKEIPENALQEIKDGNPPSSPAPTPATI